MAKLGTPKLALGTWARGDTPGAGSQTTKGSGGLNDNWLILDDAVGTQHNANGTHKDDVIDGNSIKQSATDGTTLTTNNATEAKVLKIKDAGVGTTQLANLAVTTGKLADDAVDATKLKDDGAVDANRAVTTNHIRDAAVTAAKLASNSVTTQKVAHDNTRVKILLILSNNISKAADDWFYVGNQILDATVEIPMPRAVAITGFAVCFSDGSVGANANVYSSSADNHFAANDRIGVRYNKTPSEVRLVKNGVDITNIGAISFTAAAGKTIVTLELEYD